MQLICDVILYAVWKLIKEYYALVRERALSNLAEHGDRKTQLYTTRHLPYNHGAPDWGSGKIPSYFTYLSPIFMGHEVEGDIW